MHFVLSFFSFIVSEDSYVARDGFLHPNIFYKIPTKVYYL